MQALFLSENYRIIAWNHLDNNTVHSETTECFEWALGLARCRNTTMLWTPTYRTNARFLDASDVHHRETLDKNKNKLFGMF